MASVKVAELRSVLENFANALEANKADSAAVRGVRDLCAMFVGHEGKTVAAFLKTTERVVPSAGKASGPLLAGVMPALVSLRTLVNGVAKKDLNNSLDSLLDALRIHADMPISAFVASMVSGSEQAAPPSKTKGKSKEAAAPMDDRLVDDYVKRLEAALGNDAKFEPLLEEIGADERVGQAEAVAIASRFYGHTRKSTSRPKALARIHERHVELMKFKRHPSTAGRPAA